MKLRDIGEFGFIDRIAPSAIIRPEGVIKGIGDDCAVISTRGPEYLLVTTDLLVEGVHFLEDWAPADVIGEKALAVNLSDIAACGGIPRDAFVSIAIPDRVQLEWLEGLYSGLTRMAREHNVNILGGDTTASRDRLVINVTLTGLVPSEQVLFRHTARDGDAIIITGPTGRSGAGCRMLLNRIPPETEVAASLVDSHLRPRPHVKEGRFLAASGWCHAAIDISDGLSSDLNHICRQSGLAGLIEEDSLPVATSLAQYAGEVGLDPLQWVLHGGEDYVLLAAVSADRLNDLRAEASERGIQLHRIGHFSKGKGIRLVRSNGSMQDLAPGGWDHFA